MNESSLHLHSNWLTPEGMKRRYNTWFFMAQTTTDEVEIDEGEICDYRWLSPLDALQKYFDGEMSLPPPTFVTLKRLSHFEDASSALNSLCLDPEYYRPKVVSDSGKFCSLYREDAGYQTGDINLQGARHRLTLSDEGFIYLREF